MAKAGQSRESDGDAAGKPVGMEALRGWFLGKGWRPFAFQEEAWAAALSGRSGLIHVPTGMGKTYAAYLGALAGVRRGDGAGGGGSGGGVQVVYVTPLRAVARDVELALRAPIEELGLGIRVESRTGDTASSVRARQRKSLPEVLVTTPESLSLLLAQPGASERFASLRTVLIDEWHELMSNKRGTQVELALTRLRACSPAVQTWAMSATLSNVEEAARAAVGLGHGREPVVISAPIQRKTEIRTLLPLEGSRLPWAGHLGLSMLPAVLGDLDPDVSTILFTNTRSQSERWFHAISIERPAWAARIALHHGSIDREERERVEGGVKSGEITLVVATSSLDLGVDFAPVERVYQIGSPKGVGRLLQRAGRSGHRPGEVSRVTCVPTNMLELIEMLAVRAAIREGSIERRETLECPMDVLVQHVVTCACGGECTVDGLYEEVRSAVSYASLTREAFDWAVSLALDGAGLLRAYPQYCRVVLEEGRLRVSTPRTALMHKMNMGTITAGLTVEIRYASGRRLGSIEEDFVSSLREGQRFYFAGKTVEFIGLHDSVALVRASKGRASLTPIWWGTRLPISESLSSRVRETLGRLGAAGGSAALIRGMARELVAPVEEVVGASEFVRIQSRLSVVPGADEVLIEMCQTREGSHLFVYPFEGRLVHGGIAALLAYRISKRTKVTLMTAANDYGLELVGPSGFAFGDVIEPSLFGVGDLVTETRESVNMGEMAKRQFREIARVAGLVFQTYPGGGRSGRQTQVGAGLIYDVLRDFDPANPLLEQARREVLERQFEGGRMGRTLERIASGRVVVRETEQPTPLSLPLMVERMGAMISSETLAERVERIVSGWDAPKPRSRSRERG